MPLPENRQKVLLYDNSSLISRACLALIAIGFGTLLGIIAFGPALPFRVSLTMPFFYEASARGH